MWDAVLRVATAAMAGAGVDAVGITNQRASTVGWRRSTGRPIGPAIGWQDLRTVGDCIMARINHGLALAPNQSATKIAWMLANHLPDDAARADDDLMFGTVDTWITWKLSGGSAHVTDHTNAAVTGLTVHGTPPCSRRSVCTPTSCRR
jgi:glycerol kinase